MSTCGQESNLLQHRRARAKAYHAHQMNQRGIPISVIGEQLGVGYRTVHRYLTSPCPERPTDQPQAVDIKDFFQWGSCRDKGDLMFAESPRAQARAKSVCAGCPVLAGCRMWGLTTGVNESGIWGGLNKTDRRNLAKTNAREHAQRLGSGALTNSIAAEALPTSEAAADIPALAAKAHEGSPVSDEARLLDRRPEQRILTGTWDHWRARRSAGDETVVAIERVVTSLGLRIADAPQEGSVRCTATLEKLVNLGGPGLVEATLKVFLDVWGTQADAYNAPLVHGIGLILHHLGSQVDMEKLADTLIGHMPMSLTTRATMQAGGTVPVRVATLVIHLYNRNSNVAGPRISVTQRSFGGWSHSGFGSSAA